MDLRERGGEEPTQRHPWERSRAAFFLEVLERQGGFSGQLLDAGAGDGWLAGQVARRWGAQATCWDAFYTDEQLRELSAAEPDLTFVRDQPDGPFDLVLLLDVLEHVPNDVDFLRSLVDRLAPGGQVLISVPAWPALFSAHDTFLRHYRRYRRGEALDVIERAGLRAVESGGLFHGLLPVRALQVGLEKVRGAPDPEAQEGLATGPKGWLNEAITRGLVLEQKVTHAAAGAGVFLPGLSFYALTER